MRVYLDANAIIYSIESVPPFRQMVLARIAAAQGPAAGIVLTSRLSRLECRVKPLRDGNASLTATYDAYFIQPSVHLIEVSHAVIERATDLRVRYKFKAADAIHLATAIEEHADRFLTGDKDLAR
jgi:predicted nucleic acid-binding protein